MSSTMVPIISFAGKGSFDMGLFVASTYYEGSIGALWVIVSFYYIILRSNPMMGNSGY